MGYIGNMLPRYLASLGADVHYITMDLPHYFQSTERIGSYGTFQGLDTVWPGTQEVIEGFRLHGLAHRALLGQMAYVGLRSKLAELRPNVVQSLLAIGWPPLQAALLQPRLGFRLFTANHTTASVFPLAQRASHRWGLARMRNFATRFAPGRFISRRSVRCYAATVDCADVAVRFFGVEPCKIEIAPLGVDTDRFRPAQTAQDRDERQRLREQMGFSPKDTVYIYTGQFSAGKNPMLLLQAVGRLRSRGIAARALFIGGGVQAEQLAKADYGVVQAFMPNDQLAAYYRAADVGVWPTQESTSMLDAAACGLPVVVNDTLKAVERIAGNGLQYRLNDVDDLAEVLGRLVDPGERDRLGSTGARRMRELFSWRDLASRRLRDYEVAMKEAVSGGGS
jgi:glycosyltransferase involved in cell wall biosynthesis